VLQEGKPKRHYQSGVREALTTIFRRIKLIIFVFVVVVALMAAFTFMAPDIYESEAQILVQPSRQSSTVDPAVVGPRAPGLGESLKNQMFAHREIMMSSYVAQKALEQVGVERFLESVNRPGGGMDEAIQSLSLRFAVSDAKDSNVLNLSLESEDAQVAQDTLNALLQAYIERSVELYAYQAPPDFFVRQIANTKEKLDKAVDEMRVFRREHRVGKSDGLQQHERQRQLSHIVLGVTETESELEAAKERIKVLEKALAPRSRYIELSTVGRINLVLNHYRLLIVEIKEEIKDLEALYPDDDRMLVAARAKLEIVKEAMAKEPSVLEEVQTSVDTDYDVLNNELTMERAKVEALEARLKIFKDAQVEHEQSLSQLIDDGITTGQMDLELELLTEEYSEYRNSLLRALVSRALDAEPVSNVSVIQSPTKSEEPVGPNRLLNMIMGVVLGLFGGIAMAFTRDFLDQSLKTNEDVEQRLDLPVLVAISADDFKTCT